MIVHVISQLLNLILYMIEKYFALPTFQCFLIILALILIIKIIYNLVWST